MKIRNGFVSNSSSSSFIISDNDFPTVRSLATYMIKQIIKEYKYEIKAGNEHYIDYINENKKYISDLKKIDENQSVCFPSCNYETYIRKIGDCYLVATCNNHDWNLWDYYSNLTESAKNVLKELLEKYKDSKEHDIIENILDGSSYESYWTFGNDFYDIHHNIMGVELWEDCPKCNEHMWNTPKYKKICINCDPIFKRKDKLDIINKIAN